MLKPDLARLLPRARLLLRAPLQHLTLILAGDGLMARLHGQFMNIATPTDVLTFPIDLDPRGRRLSGEVYICIPEARRQARVRGVRLEHETLLYALHGMLHLCGFDDRTPSDYPAMHRKEDDILQRLGVGAVFAPPPAPPSPFKRAASPRGGGDG